MRDRFRESARACPYDGAANLCLRPLETEHAGAARRLPVVARAPERRSGARPIANRGQVARGGPGDQGASRRLAQDLSGGLGPRDAYDVGRVADHMPAGGGGPPEIPAGRSKLVLDEHEGPAALTSGIAGDQPRLARCSWRTFARCEASSLAIVSRPA